MDITDVILNDHHEQRRLFAYLDEIDRDNTEALSAVWKRLEILLDVHAAAEEKFFYPHLLDIGTGAGGEDTAASETLDVIKDHNEIRDAVADVGRHEVGSDSWREAVVKAREANSDHMAEEERQDLADFRHHADFQLRHDIAVAFVTFESENAGGIIAKDRDPETFVTNHASQ
ncbi:hemerythrin domain-containing protein [Lacisediminihabitans sp. H27-G8]|uniref:hemerythrin domain-containing protein n=1 Tax=Lacisediminihabitans sp. H27-G8 TaxID=3111909 RepID=UPI0038FCE880